VPKLVLTATGVLPATSHVAELMERQVDLLQQQVTASKVTNFYLTYQARQEFRYTTSQASQHRQAGFRADLVEVRPHIPPMTQVRPHVVLPTGHYALQMPTVRCTLLVRCVECRESYMLSAVRLHTGD
jgi:hypothetical protein